jgi:formylglycine-generating enzyme required for sulfatase activity
MKMFRNLIILLIIIYFNSCFLVINPEKQQKQPYYGMKKFTEKKYVDITEVTVTEWLEYYNWVLKNEGKKEAIKALPDSNNVSVFVWKYIQGEKKKMEISAEAGEEYEGFLFENCDEIVKNDKFYQSMYKNKKINPCPYGIEPITGISYEQALDYCNWKTILKGNDKTIYRLPTKEEWVQLAYIGLSETEKLKRTMDSSDNSCDCHFYNFKFTFKEYAEDGSSVIEVARFSPNHNGVYDLLGNISEMTMTKGEAKGGNYNINASQCHIDSTQYYIKPEKWLGFRCIAEEK